MDNVNTSELPSQSRPNPATRGIDPLNAIRLLRSAGSAICGQAELYGELARVEWAEEKNRLLKMLTASMVGIVCLLCTSLFVGVLVLALSWDTAYRIHAVIAMLVLYAAGIAIARHWLQTLSALSDKSFSATREEIAADLALIKSKL